MACQPQNANLPSNNDANKELEALEEAELLALAKVSPYIYASTYKTDFWERGKNGVYTKVLV